MLTKNKKLYLRKLAMSLRPTVQIGKLGISDGTLKTLSEALLAHELVKVSVLQNNDDDRDDLILQILEASGAELVQKIGRQIILYKKNPEKEIIQLPKSKKG